MTGFQIKTKDRRWLNIKDGLRALMIQLIPELLADAKQVQPGVTGELSMSRRAALMAMNKQSIGIISD
jgi:hypothetical protein